GDQRGEPGVGAEPDVDGVGVGVQVEQAPQPLHGGGEVARVGEVEAGVQPAARACPLPAGGGAGALVDRRDTDAVGEPQGAAVGAGSRRAVDGLDAGDGLACEQVEDGAGGAGAAVGEAQRDPGGGRGGAARGPSGAGGGGPQGAGGGGVDGADGVVELPDAGEAGREGDGRHRQIGGLE